MLFSLTYKISVHSLKEKKLLVQPYFNYYFQIELSLHLIFTLFQNLSHSHSSSILFYSGSVFLDFHLLLQNSAGCHGTVRSWC